MSTIRISLGKKKKKQKVKVLVTQLYLTLCDPMTPLSMEFSR